MLALYFGSDRTKIRDEAQQFISSNYPDHEVVTIDEHDFAPGMFTEIAGSDSLFGTSFVYLIDTPSAAAEFKNETEESLALLAESSHLFVVLEGPLLAPAKKRYQKYTDAVHEFKAESSARFNTFALADALVRKDKRSLWLLYQEAKLTGLREEEMIGVLWWQLKSLRLAAATRSAEEAGMKSFPYTKAKKALQQLPLEEAESLAHSLLRVYHDGHKGVRPIDTGLETWLLSV